MPEEKVVITIQGKDRLSAAVKQSAASLKKLANVAQAAAALALVALAGKAIKAAAAIAKLGASSIAAREKLIAFAGGSQKATAMIDAFSEGLAGTVDRATATIQVLKLVQSGIITTAEQARLAGEGILELGDPLLSTAKNAEKFSQMMANTSYVMVDTFGLSKAAVKVLAKEFEVMGHTAEEAFRLAVFEEMGKAVEVVGDDVGRFSKELEELNAELTNLKTTAAEGFGEVLDASGFIPWAIDATKRLSTTISQLTTMWIAADAASRASFAAQKEGASAAEASIAGQEAHAAAILKRIGVLDEEKEAQLAANKEKRDAADASDAATAALKRETLAASKAQKQWISLGMAMTSLHKRRMKEQARFAEQAEDLERSHRRRLQNIRDDAMGTEQSREDRRYRDVIARLDAEQRARLDALRREYGFGEDFGSKRESLEAEHKRRMMGLYTKSARKQEEKRHAAAMKQLEFEEKEAAIIAEFQGEKEQAEKAHADATMDIKRRALNAEIAEENAAYARSLAQLQRSREEANEAYQESLGRMQLRLIDYWESTGQISAEQAMAMRLAVLEEYNLMADEVIAIMGRIPAFPSPEMAGVGAPGVPTPGAPYEPFLGLRDQPSAPAPRPSFGGGLGIIGGRGVEKPTALGVIGGGRIKQPRGASPPLFQDVPYYAQGTPFHPGGPAVVGDAGPEMLNLPRGASVTPGGGGTTINVTNNFGENAVRSEQDIYQVGESVERSLELRGVRTL